MKLHVHVIISYYSSVYMSYCYYIILMYSVFLRVCVDVLKGYAEEVGAHTSRNPKDLQSPSSFAGHSGAGVEITVLNM